MRIPGWLSFRCVTVILIALAVLAPRSAESAPVQVIVARASPINSKPWASFQQVRFDTGAVIATGGAWTRRIAPPPGDLRHVFVHLSGVKVAAGATATVEFLDDAQHVLAKYDRDFLASAASFSTPPLPPGPITIQVRGPVASGDLDFKVDGLWSAAMPDVPKLQSLGSALVFYPQMDAKTRQLARGLVLLTIADKDACTGFLIPGGRVVTAFHCLANSASYAGSLGQAVRTCTDVTIAFDYTVIPYGAVQNPRCKEVAAGSSGPPADIAVLVLNGAPPGPPGRELSLAPADPVAGAPLMILEHPADFPTAAVLGCQVQNQPSAPRFEHNCDTSGGASGSPVMTTDGHVVGVHTDGYIQDSATTNDIIAARYALCAAGHCPNDKGTLVSRLKQALK